MKIRRAAKKRRLVNGYNLGLCEIVCIAVNSCIPSDSFVNPMWIR